MPAQLQRRLSEHRRAAGDLPSCHAIIHHLAAAAADTTASQRPAAPGRRRPRRGRRGRGTPELASLVCSRSPAAA
jgi:hypothetical protein